MRLAVVAVVAIGLVRTADGSCPDDPACPPSKECCTQKRCPDDSWDTYWVRTPGCATSDWGERTTPPPDDPHCGKMKVWLEKDTLILKAYVNQTLVMDGIRNGWTISRYQDEVAKASGAEMSNGRANDVMSTGADCKVNNVASGCAWLKSKGLPDVACKMAEAHETVHAAQCTSMSGPPKSVIDASIREITAHIMLLRAIRAWLEGQCPSGGS